MARTAIQVDIPRLRRIFLNLDGKVSKQGDLWVAIAAQYNQNLPSHLSEISFSVVKGRILEAKWEVKTPKGKRGRKDVYLSRSGKRISKKEKFENNSQIQESLKQILASTPKRFHPVALKVIEGSRSAALKLKCLDCTHWSTPEIRHCAIPSCSLFPFRPYQGKPEIEEITQEAA